MARPTAHLIAIGLLVCAALISTSTIGCSPDRGDSNDVKPSERPNIILMISDDHGWPYFGFMGDPIVQTPNIDALADRGMAFPFGYAHGSICRPSLMSLLTGLYTDQWDDKNLDLQNRGLLTNSLRHEFREIEFYRTLPRELAKLGYASFQGGKHWEGLFSEAGFTAGTKITRGKSRLSMVEHSGAAAKFARESIAAATDFIDGVGDRPFFMWFAPDLPHYPLDAPEEFRQLYAGKGLTKLAQAYYANISRLDARIGDLLVHLERSGRLDNTLLIFLSDNGWEQDPFEDRFMQLGLGGPRGKASEYELGFRTPVLFSYPGRIATGRGDDLVLGIDIFATILDYAGGEQLSDRFGVSLRSQLEGREGTRRSHIVEKADTVRMRSAAEVAENQGQYVVNSPVYFVRNKYWRYISRQDTGVEELYRIDTDPYETRDVVTANADTAGQMRELLEQSRDKLRRDKDGYDLDGEVRDSESLQPIAKMVLLLTTPDGERVSLQATSDAEGRFEFRDVPSGEYLLSAVDTKYRISHLGRPLERIALPQGSIGGFIALDVATRDAHPPPR